jgi:regulator of sigma E protease
MVWFLHNILPFLVILSILVFVHEFGHFWVARRNGVRVSTFSIGFGPEIIGWTDRLQTRWRFSLIPLGGYVKFYGDSDVSSATTDKSVETLSDEERSQTLHSKTPMQRIAVAFAGPFANYLLAFALLVVLIMMKGVPTTSSIIGMVEKESVAEKMGLRVDDKIVAFGDIAVKDFFDVKKAIGKYAGKDADVLVARGDQTVTLKAELYTKSGEDVLPVKKIGIAPGAPVYEKKPLFEAAYHSLAICYDLSKSMLVGLYQLITRSKEAGEMGGIIAIGDMAAESVKHGMASILWFMAILSINLGLINLLPIPVLDGGHILLCTIEGIRGKPLSEKMQERIFTVGFALIISLMIYATWSDLIRYKVGQAFVSLLGLG